MGRADSCAVDEALERLRLACCLRPRSLRRSSAVQCVWRVCQGQPVTHCCSCCCRVAPASPPQYHPEASPGPHDADICFQQFYEMMKAEALVKA